LNFTPREAFLSTNLAKSVASIAHRLTNLDLSVNGAVDPFLALTFPSLTRLALRCYSLQDQDKNKATSMAFWRRHPQLLHLFLKDVDPDEVSGRDGSLFMEEFIRMDDILPNLMSLTVSRTHPTFVSSTPPFILF
jgi:hypothetical protein